MAEPRMLDSIARLQAALDREADPRTKAWWERYLKGEISFRGVKMAAIRSALHDWYEAEGMGAELSLTQQRDLAYELIRQSYAEDKLAGILFLQEILLPQGALGCPADLDAMAGLFEAGYIHEWNTCDWFCVKVLGRLVEQQGEGCARGIAEWRHGENLWQRRASGVAFVNLAKKGEANFAGFTELLLEVCRAMVESPERFAQTGTGWVLRELSAVEPDRVVEFIAQNEVHFTRDGWTYLTQKMPKQIRDRIVSMRTS